MLYKELLELLQSGALSVSYTDGAETGTVGGVTITKAQADQICKGLGWEEYTLSPFKIISKTAKFMKGMDKEIESEIIKNNTEVTFRNVMSPTYMKDFDRIHLHCKHVLKGFEVTVIYNMPKNSARYVVYRTSNSYPLFKGRTLQDAAEYIESLG